MFQQLEGEADAHLVGVGQKGKQAVVIALATAKAHAMAVESHSGDDGKVYGGIGLGEEDFSRGFHDAVCTWLQGTGGGYA